MDTPTPGGTARGGLFESLRNLLATLLTIASTRLELLTTELQEELHRVAEVLFWSVAAFLFGTLGVLMLGVFAIVVYWDEHRLLAAGIVTGTFLALAAIAGLVVRARIRSRPRLLSATIEELRHDRDALRERR
jgi:uncharacterized membrane protein YqjE